MRIGHAERYKINRVEARRLSGFHLQETLGHWTGEVIGAEAWALGEAGEPLKELPFEVLYSAVEREAIICSGNKAVSTAADSIEDAIERFLGINGKKLAEHSAV